MMTYVALQQKSSSQAMYGFFDSRVARINDIQVLDEHLRADIGLATRDAAPDSPSDATSAAARSSLAATLRTSARAFAMPLAIADTCLG